MIIKLTENDHKTLLILSPIWYTDFTIEYEDPKTDKEEGLENSGVKLNLKEHIYKI